MLPSESSCQDGSEYVWQRGEESLQGRYMATQSWPLFREKKNHLRRCYEKLGGHNFDFRAKSSWVDVRNVHKKSAQADFALKSKLWPPSFSLPPPYFCWQLAFYWHLPTSGSQTRSKQPRSHFCRQGICCHIRNNHFIRWTPPDISLRFRAGGRRLKYFRFSRISISLW